MSIVSVGTIQSNTSSPVIFTNSSSTEIGTLCRAFCNFNGTTVTNPASMTGVRASFNVSSILDNGTGDYTVNFTTAMPDANYATVLTGGNSGGLVAFMADATTAPTASAVRIRTANSTFVLTDQAITNVAIFR